MFLLTLVSLNVSLNFGLVLHIGEHFWIKHRITTEEAIAGLIEATDGTFVARQGEPDAGEMERRQAERN